MLNQILEETKYQYLRGNIDTPSSPIPKFFFYIGVVGLFVLYKITEEKQVLPMYRKHLR